jgi:hypothetical protein
MSVRLLVHNFLPPSASPYRLVDDRGCEVAWVNQFLDAQKLRQQAGDIFAQEQTLFRIP